MAGHVRERGDVERNRPRRRRDFGGESGVQAQQPESESDSDSHGHTPSRSGRKTHHWHPGIMDGARPVRRPGRRRPGGPNGLYGGLAARRGPVREAPSLTAS